MIRSRIGAPPIPTAGRFLTEELRALNYNDRKSIMSRFKIAAGSATATKTRRAAGFPTAPRPTLPRRGRRLPELELGRWGRATYAPVPLVRTTGGGDGCRRNVPFGSGSTEPDRDELRA